MSTAGGVPGNDLLPDRLPPGAKAGPWRVEQELGRGGMGAVYAVVHDEIGKRAALKLMHRRLGDAHNDRMLVEARVVNMCRHPNIVDIFETGSLPDGRPYIVMERLDGLALSTRADEGKVRPDRAIEILAQVASALIAAHDAGIVHRDLKLDNIFLVDHAEDVTPHVKVLDWGIAKEIASDVRQTIEGQLVGTPQYLAPEQARGAAVSAQTDVYSLGVVAFELFLEQLPFEAETAAEVMAMHLRSTPPVPSELWPDIPGELEDLLLAMLEKSPDRRPTMREVVIRLERVRAILEQRKVSHEPVIGATTGPIEPRFALQWSDTQRVAPHRARWWQFAVGATAVVAAAVMLLISHVDDSQAAAIVAAPIAIDRPARAPAAAVQPIQIPIPAPVAAPVPSVLPHPVVEHRATKRPAPAPRRPLHVDPNGTLDVYGH
jgi:serine/threonine-protein kinase